MRLLTVCALIGLGVAGVAAWQLLDSERPSQVVTAAAESGGGGAFVPMPMPDGMPSRGIVIFAPANCPSDAAQRADAMARYLSGRGIAFVRSSAAEFSNLSSREEAERVRSVMNGPIPVVYVNGRARANPRPEDVEAEYRRVGRG